MDHEMAYLGVAGLDELIPEGLPYSTQILVHGDTGIGKSVFAAQFIQEGLAVGDTCVYIACDERPDVMRQMLTSFRTGSLAYEEAGRLIFVDAYSRAGSTEKYWIREPSVLDEFYLHERELLEELSDRKVRLLVDSLSTIFVTNSERDYLLFNSNRLKLLRRMEVLTLDGFVRGVLDSRAVATIIHAYPVIINMQFQEVNGGTRRIIQLGKMKSGEFQANRMPFTINPRMGLIVGG